jgi:hypothetical protein
MVVRNLDSGRQVGTILKLIEQSHTVHREILKSKLQGSLKNPLLN